MSQFFAVAVVDMCVHFSHLGISSIDFSVTMVYYEVSNTFLYPYKVCDEKAAFSLNVYPNHSVLIHFALFFTFLMMTYLGCWFV